jgi:endonuclease/exonuclease/phosphatase family metal-dependent hydrolase
MLGSSREFRESPFFSLDRIWVRPTETVISLDVHKTRLARIASDHLPVKAIIKC